MSECICEEKDCPNCPKKDVCFPVYQGYFNKEGEWVIKKVKDE